ncbi:hypothetical protein N7488_001357 [Penicillium malachiteum]|nr:hypothetical protein N7488_001357 [Penicillium malachiteum]
MSHCLFARTRVRPWDKVKVILTVLCYRSFYFHRKPKPPSPEDLLAKLNITSPVRKLEEWWGNTGRELGSSEDLGRLFNCPVCLEDVSQTQEIRELPCSHVFHRGCLDEWFFRGHYYCP